MIESKIAERLLFSALISLVCLLAINLPASAKSETKNETKAASKNVSKKTLGSKVKKDTRQQKQRPQLAQTHYNSLQNPQGLPEGLIKLLNKYKIPKQNISIYIRDLNAASPMLTHNADKLRTPASTMKLLTTYAALKTLGPNYSWRTEVWLRGDLKNGVLNGDLLLKGYGDPFLVYENFWKLVKTLRDKGLKQINGNIIIDNTYFKLDKHDPAAFDGKAYRIYNAQSSAMMFNFQATRFLFTPLSFDKDKALTSKKKKRKSTKRVKDGKGKGKGKVNVVPFPRIDNFIFDNQIKLTKGRCRKSHFRPKLSKNKKGIMVIKGNYAAKCGQRFILRAISNPEEHVFYAFRDFWLDLGGTFKGGLKTGRVTEDDELFHVYSSPTLGQQMRLINKWSNNVMTRQLLLTLGARKYGVPGTLDKGRRAVLDVLTANNIDTNGIRLENGSGLSRIAQISAKQMGKLLETAFRDPFMPEFMASLSLPGIDGTLVNRFRKDDLRGRSHFKTGTLDYVTAIAGYMLNRKGKRLVVVIQHNGKRTGAGRGAKIQDVLIRWSFEQ
jgi:D-alanyl-D-alanine carboxypeptidase/D-alanyl-D-alanine-endopeptidase (penicillin-binding protein 4)